MTPPMSNLRVGFLGSGKMATALAKGFLRGKILPGPEHIAASCPVQDKHLLSELSSLGCHTLHCNRTLVSQSDLVLLAVKPNVVPKVMEEVRPTLEEKKTNLLVSLAAGVTLKQLQQMAGNHTRVIRLMPNTPCVVGEGASVFSRGAGATDNDCAAVATLLSAVGDCHEVVEAMIDGVTGVSGSGVAYMYLIIEAMADGGVKQGLPRDLAYRLAAQTMVGAGQMVLRTRSHPAVLKDEVCSPGGTTIAALDILEKSGLRTSMMQAVEAAAKRCHELTQ